MPSEKLIELLLAYLSERADNMTIYRYYPQKRDSIWNNEIDRDYPQKRDSIWSNEIYRYYPQKRDSIWNNEIDRYYPQKRDSIWSNEIDRYYPQKMDSIWNNEIDRYYPQKRDSIWNNEEWEALLRLATKNGVAPLLYHRLNADALTVQMPKAVQADLRKAYYRNAFRNALYILSGIV